MVSEDLTTSSACLSRKRSILSSKSSLPRCSRSLFMNPGEAMETILAHPNILSERLGRYDERLRYESRECSTYVASHRSSRSATVLSCVGRYEKRLHDVSMQTT